MEPDVPTWAEWAKKNLESGSKVGVDETQPAASGFKMR